jgi:hypothetical protein
VRSRVGTRLLAHVLVDHPEVPQHTALELPLADRLARETVGEFLEVLLVIDRHPKHLSRLGELGLQVARVAEPERALGGHAVL